MAASEFVHVKTLAKVFFGGLSMQFSYTDSTVYMTLPLQPSHELELLLNHEPMSPSRPSLLLAAVHDVHRHVVV